MEAGQGLLSLPGNSPTIVDTAASNPSQQPTSCREAFTRDAHSVLAEDTERVRLGYMVPSLQCEPKVIKDNVLQQVEGRKRVTKTYQAQNFQAERHFSNPEL